MMGRLRAILIVLAVLNLVLAMTAMGGAADGADAPCPDFFYQDPLPTSDWPVLAAADANTAWAVSLGGLIVKTADGGATWDYQWSDLQAAPDAPPLRDICAVNAEVAWICGDGGAVLLTEDGGATWQDKSIAVPMQSFRLLGISALNRNVAWVVGQDNSVYRTSDGGGNWTPCPLPGAAKDITAVSALGNQEAWVAGNGRTAAVTTDGGATWTPRDPAVGTNCTLTRIKAFDLDHVYAAGDSGEFFSTDNGGNTWDFADLGVNAELYGMSFSDAQHGWVSGTLSGEAGYMAVTGNGGQNWTRIDPPQLEGERNVTSIGAAGADTIWSCTVDGGLLRSVDGGGSWVRSDTVWTRETLSGVCAVDARGAWTVGTAGTILRTFNGGRTWVEQSSHVNKTLSSVDAADSSTAWAVGDEGTIVKTADYGTTWTPQVSGTDADLNRVAAVSGSEAWACGSDQDNGFVLHTVDGGGTWTADLELAGASVSAITTMGGAMVWFGAVEEAGGLFKGYIYRSEDAGASWSRRELAPPVPIQHVSCVEDIKPIDENLCLALVTTVAALDSFEYLYKSTDGGESWKLVDVRVSANGNLFRMATVDGENIWACGARGDAYTEPTTVIYTGDGGKNWNTGKNFHRTVLFDMDTVDGQVTWTVGYISTIQRSTCPSLFSISPHTAPDTGVTSITDLAGSFFWEGMQVWLEKDGVHIDATNVSVKSPYEATCDFDLAGADAGIYDVVARNANGLEGRLPGGFVVTSPNTWYLPEGSTGSGAAGSFETWVLVENPNAGTADVTITYMTPGGEVAGPQITMAGESRLTVNVADSVPNEWSVSTRVEASAPVVAERAMYWSSGSAYRQSAGGSIGLDHLSRDWFLAEGSTGAEARGSFETWVLVQNPTDKVADVNITYMTGGGAVAGPHLELQPRTRQTVSVADTVPGEWGVSTAISSNVPVAAERSTYWNGEVYRQAASNSIGTSGPSREWYLAEGSTGTDARGSLETWVLIANPSEHSVQAKIYYQLPYGQVEGPDVTVAPFSRATVYMGDTVPGEFDVSAFVEADGPVVVERATYWNTATYRQAAHASIGATSPRNEWLLAEGSTGADAQGSFDTWILVQNPNGGPAEVRLTYMTPGGPVDGPLLEMAARSRSTVSVAETLPGSWSVATKVVSDVPVVAERAMYWNAAGQSWRSAQSSLGCAAD
ncbi:MAG: YCF48-related protein [Actinomycetota bacterium]